MNISESNAEYHCFMIEKFVRYVFQPNSLATVLDRACSITSFARGLRCLMVDPKKNNSHGIGINRIEMNPNKLLAHSGLKLEYTICFQHRLSNKDIQTLSSLLTLNRK